MRETWHLSSWVYSLLGEIKSLFARTVIRKYSDPGSMGRKDRNKRSIRSGDNFPEKWRLRRDIKYK